jgi:hypothetical protein
MGQQWPLMTIGLLATAGLLPGAAADPVEDLDVGSIRECILSPDPVPCLIHYIKNGCTNVNPIQVCRVCYAFHLEKFGTQTNLITYMTGHSPIVPTMDDLIAGHATAVFYGLGTENHSGNGLGRHVFEIDLNGVPGCE